MKNIDISRDSFDPRRNYSRVLLQQGRVQLDADWNEQTAILLRQLRLTILDLFGPHAGPMDECGFIVISPGDAVPDTTTDHDKHRIKELLGECEPGDFVLTGGRYYVGGLLCESHAPLRYSHQAIDAHQPHGIEEAGRYLVYLDVWEREVTALQDEHIREIALGGADTAARMQIAWSVRTERLEPGKGVNETFRSMNPSWHEHVARWEPRRRGALKARARDDSDPDEFAAGEVQANYRGPENQLYRIEIHRGGRSDAVERPTFKWSRDNGIVALPIEELAPDGSSVTLHHWGRDDTAAIRIGDWVEVLDANASAHHHAGRLLRVEAVDIARRIVSFAGKAHLPRPQPGHVAAPVLRRWDQKTVERRSGAADMSEGAMVVMEDRWLPIEDGIEILFERSTSNVYRGGDYWLVPARVASADVVWPRDGDEPLFRPPDGVEHHFAPLAIVDVDGTQTSVIAALTRRFGFRKQEDVTGDVLSRG